MMMTSVSKKWKKQTTSTTACRSCCTIRTKHPTNEESCHHCICWSVNFDSYWMIIFVFVRRNWRSITGEFFFVAADRLTMMRRVMFCSFSFRAQIDARTRRAAGWRSFFEIFLRSFLRFLCCVSATSLH